MSGTAPGTNIPIAGLANLRDLGGWPVGGGRRVRRGLLFRSTDLDRLDASGLATIGALRLRTVIDLRTAAERRDKPDRDPPGAAGVVCDVLGDAPDAAPAQLPRIMADPANAGAILGGGKAVALFEHGYREIVALPSAVAAYRAFVALLADPDRRPLLFHCSTGKDRTGWAAAITLTLLGVSADDISRDYLLTNDQLLPALRPVLDRFAAAGGDPALLGPVLGVQSCYLEAAYDEARLRYGSMEGYLADGLRISDDLRRRLREDLTEEAA